MFNTHLLRAIDFAGSQTNLAKFLGITPGAVNNWLRRGKVPPEHCQKIERLTDGEVTAVDLRPDVFGV